MKRSRITKVPKTAWGEVFLSWRHGQPLRTGVIPEWLRKPLNIWRYK